MTTVLFVASILVTLGGLTLLAALIRWVWDNRIERWQRRNEYDDWVNRHGGC